MLIELFFREVESFEEVLKLVLVDVAVESADSDDCS